MGGFLGKLLGGGAAEVLKEAGTIVDDVITNKEEAILAKAKLEEVINQNSQKMVELANQLEQSYLDDIANARAMNIAAIGSSDSFIRRFIYYLAAVVIIAAFAMFILFISGEIPIENKDIALIILGSLTTTVSTIVAFFYGSSKGSEAKNETIKNLSGGNTTSK